jgi:hypothetical protein
MKVFVAILSLFCLGAMMSEKDIHNKMLYGACFIATIVAILIMFVVPLRLF